jgi:hypothetical protein
VTSGSFICTHGNQSLFSLHKKAASSKNNHQPSAISHQRRSLCCVFTMVET